MPQLLRSLRAKLIVLWVLCGALFVAGTSVIVLRTSLNAQFAQLRQTVLGIAATGALAMDGELHEQIAPHRTSLQSPAYRLLTDRLRAIRNSNPNIRYVYTMRPSDQPGEWYYIGDAEERRGYQSLPGERYDVTRYAAMAEGLVRPSADPAITVDTWGPLLSGYAPIRNRAGDVVGVLGVDLSGEYVRRTQTAARRWAIVVVLIGLVGLIALAALIAQRITRPLRELVIGTKRIGSGDLTHRVPVRSDDEIGLLARAFNRMADRLVDSVQQLREHVLSTLQTLSNAIEAKDRYTRGHSARVQHYAVKIAEQLGLPEAQVELIREMSALHDIGKLGIHENILIKPGALTSEEFEVIKRHPEVGYKILLPLKLPKEALDIVRHHHERLDGGGYPDGLHGPQIPELVGIVTAADAYDAMTGHRPYRPVPMTAREAVDELRRCSGTQFLPRAVEALIEVLRREGHAAEGR